MEFTVVVPANSTEESTNLIQKQDTHTHTEQKPSVRHKKHLGYKDWESFRSFEGILMVSPGKNDLLFFRFWFQVNQK